jgi:hypothetical protein
MIPLLKHLLSRLLNDELAVRRWGRAALMGAAAGGLAFADQLAAILEAPGLVRAIKVVAVVCGFLSLAVTAGEKNRPEEPKA